MESALYYVTTALGISIIVNLILKRLGISQIIGYIMTGVVVAYAFDLRHMADSHALESIAEFGIVFLMFTIGLEMSLQRLAMMKIDVFFNGFFANDDYRSHFFSGILWYFSPQFGQHH